MRHVEYACSLRSASLMHVLEFGVYTGESIRLLRTVLPSDVEIFGFDSFQGLPDDWRDTNGELVGACVRGFFSTDGKIPDVSGVTFYVGWFEDTLDDYLPIARPIGLLHFDCDLYSSTRTVLNGLDQLIVPDTIMIFDEWIYNHAPLCNDHEQRAFYEWVDERNRAFELVPFIGESDEQQIVRITR